MKFTVERDVLADAVAWAARALPARPSVPVLAGILLAAEADTLTLSTFDYEVSAKSSVPVITDEGGTVLVSGRLLAEIVKSLPARPVEMSTEGARTTLKCGSAVFTLMTLPDDEYPALPPMPPEAGKVGADLLAHAITQVAIAAGRDDTLLALTGIRIEFADGLVTLVATDRYRLAVRTFPWVPDPGQPWPLPGILVPAKTLTEAAKSFGSAAEVTVGLEETGEQGSPGIIGLDAGGRQMTARLLGGEYPRYQALLPTEFSAVAELETGPFAEAVKRVALVAERNTPVRLKFSAKDGLTLEAGAGDEATASETVPAEFDGEDLQVNFNPQYLLDGLTAIGSDTARLSFTTPTRPAVLTGKTEGPPDYRYVLMPIRSAG